MNIGLLELASKWVSLVVISVMTLFNGSYVERELEIDNKNAIKDVTVVNTVTPYKVETTYNAKLPSNVSKVVVEGQDGIEVKSEDNEVAVVQEVVNEVVEKGSGAYGVYTGFLTGYGPDCAGCSGTGNLACKTREKTTFSLTKDGMYYTDTEYGKVRILAAALSKFPCGTIIKVTKEGKDPFLGIVLDTGATMVNKLNEGIIWLDLAYTSEKDKTVFGVDGLTGANIKFDVQRWGW